MLHNGRATIVDQSNGKLSAKWEVPYVVYEEVRLGTYILTYEDGHELPWT